MHQNIEIDWNLKLDRSFTFQQDDDPKHTARVAYRQLCECPWVDQPQPGLECNQIFLEKPEKCICPHPTWQSLRHKEMRKMADNCQILKCKACHIIPKKAVKMLRLSTEWRVWRLMECTYISSFFSINSWSCDNSVFALSLLCMECRLMWEKKVIQSRLTQGCNITKLEKNEGVWRLFIGTVYIIQLLEKILYII